MRASAPSSRKWIVRLPTLAAVAVVLLAAPFAAGAQQAGKVYRIGFLSFGSADLRHPKSSSPNK